MNGVDYDVIKLKPFPFFLRGQGKELVSQFDNGFDK